MDKTERSVLVGKYSTKDFFKDSPAVGIRDALAPKRKRGPATVQIKMFESRLRGLNARSEAGSHNPSL